RSFWILIPDEFGVHCCADDGRVPGPATRDSRLITYCIAELESLRLTTGTRSLASVGQCFRSWGGTGSGCCDWILGHSLLRSGHFTTRVLVSTSVRDLSEWTVPVVYRGVHTILALLHIAGAPDE